MNAFDVNYKPVIIEDVSAGLESLGSLLVVFIKVFGEDALRKLSKQDCEVASTQCTAYYDGSTHITLKCPTKGIISELKGNNGFGFNKIFTLNGSNKTNGEMEPIEKDKFSYRPNAIK
jgi:inosine/xanthosine triphosphate pyrophosphatase family protein